VVSNHLGSVRQVVDADTGDVVQALRYDAWGNVTVEQGEAGYQPFGFAGGLWDVDTGLVRFGARDYDPEVGRWTAKDPTRFKGGDTNLFGYVGARPTQWTDPSGQAPPSPMASVPGILWQYETGAISYGEALLYLTALLGSTEAARKTLEEFERQRRMDPDKKRCPPGEPEETIGEPEKPQKDPYKPSEHCVEWCRSVFGGGIAFFACVGFFCL